MDTRQRRILGEQEIVLRDGGVMEFPEAFEYILGFKNDVLEKRKELVNNERHYSA